GAMLEAGSSGSGMIPSGFGKGCNRGEGGAIGGRRSDVTGDWLAASAAGVDGEIAGGTRRGGTTGVREGNTIRAVSFVPPFCPASFVAVLGGRAMRTVSFF